MTTELRSIEGNLEVKDDDQMIVEGYALRFNTWSEDLGKFIETISPNALKKTKLDDVRLLFNHDWNHVLGRQSANTLDLEVDEVGLRFKARLPNTSYAKDIYEQIRAGNINQCSFHFNADKKSIDMKYDNERGLYKRTINSINQIKEISIVSLPAYKETDVSVALRSITEIEENDKKLKLLKIENELFNL